MNQPIESQHRTDESGMPTGGWTKGRGFEINWQDGPLLDKVTGERLEPNGAFVEGIISAALDRLRFYQSTRFTCRENALTITKLEEALHWCQSRTRARELQGVEGTHQTHK